jgi:hypothetical protein
VPDDRKQPEDKPETALGEALQETSDAAHRTADSAERRRRRGGAGAGAGPAQGRGRRRGGAGEAITPNTRAQEDSEGE